jgi:hypothetical protein
MPGDQDGPRQSESRGFTLVGDPTEGEAGAQPPVNFTTFVLSLSTSALLHLGVAAPEELGGEQREVNLPMARQTIEMLEMIRDKTRGNLSTDEAALLQHVLHDLRMRYVEVSSGHA